ncbi:hypothetical protein CARUB_v10028573mg [Capsella rubella]|uniref:Uncharacterized protein n=1 Tax=Capsella rubella TaxID=81985 RepID=R0EUJ1_9BRAS|nr:hypothetical protein CARUB_v10028573mg [Capsella rubella]
MVRTPCCKEEGIKKGAWTPEEDQKLIAYVQLHGEGGWRTLPEKADIKRGEFTPEEDDTIIKLHAIKGNKWAAIAASLAGRTDNEIKNYWNTNLKKRIKQIKKGLVDPITHNSSSTGTQNAIEPTNNNKPVRSSGSARLLNRVASKYAVDFNRDLLIGLISSGNRTGEIDPRDSTLLNIMVETSSSVYNNSSSTLSDDISDNSCFNEFFSNEEIISDDVYTTIDNIDFMEELKEILNGSGAEIIENASNAADEIGCWNE